jgi:hypothetical protein
MILNPYTAAPYSVAPQMWADSDMSSTLFQSGTRGAEGTPAVAHNDPVGLVLDRSGNNVDLTQGTAGSKPLYGISGPISYFDFDGTDDFLTNTSPGLISTGYPLSCGCWFNPDATNSVIWGYTDTGAAEPGSRFFGGMSGSNQVTLSVRNTGAPQDGLPTTGTVTLGAWHYAVWRFISATNRRLSVLFPNGVIEHVQDTTNVGATSLDALFIGGYKHNGATLLNIYNGKIGRDFWIVDSDIQAGGAQLSDATLLKLAYGGPAL